MMSLAGQAWSWWAMICLSLKPQQEHNGSREPSLDQTAGARLPGRTRSPCIGSSIRYCSTSLALGGWGMAVVGSSDPEEEAASSHCRASAGTGVT